MTTTDTKPTTFPGRRSSPSAQALFAAFDASTGAAAAASATTTTTTSSLLSSNQQQQQQQRPRRSSEMQLKIQQTLGWRNRYSQDKYYPCVVNAVVVDGGAAGMRRRRQQQPSHEQGASSSSPSPTDGSDLEDEPQQQQPCRYEFSVRQVQRGELDGTYGTGATVWPASLVLLKYLERHAATLIQDKMVVDLGSGTGITSIAAALLGARRVICTDGEPAVVQLARDNVSRCVATITTTTPAATTAECSNDSSSTSPLQVIEVQEYWWGSGVAPGDDDNVDVVLVSDCVLPKLYPIAPLVVALDQLLCQPDALAILSYEHRYYPEYDPRDHFRALAQEKGLSVSVIPLPEQDPVYSTDDIELWHVQRIPCAQALS